MGESRVIVAVPTVGDGSSGTSGGMHLSKESRREPLDSSTATDRAGGAAAVGMAAVTAREMGAAARGLEAVTGATWVEEGRGGRVAGAGGGLAEELAASGGSGGAVAVAAAEGNGEVVELSRGDGRRAATA